MDLFGSRYGDQILELQDDLKHAFDRIEALQSTPLPLPTTQDILGAVGAPLDALRERLARLETLPQGFANLLEKMKDLTFAVSEGIERSDRAERRIHATIKRARAELKKRGYEDPGLESEAYELHAVDGGGGGARELPPVRDSVESSEEASSIAGVSVAELRRANSSRLRLYQ